MCVLSPASNGLDILLSSISRTWPDSISLEIAEVLRTSHKIDFNIAKQPSITLSKKNHAYQDRVACRTFFNRDSHTLHRDVSTRLRTQGL